MENVTNILAKQLLTESMQPSAKPSAITAPESFLKQILTELTHMKLLTADPGAYRVWSEGLADLPVPAIRMGMRKVKNFTGFLSLPAFRELCRITPQDLGLPETRDAMSEACCAQDWQTHNWTHPAIYHAACSVGSYDMRHMTSRELFPLFDVAYQQVVRRVLAGESLEVPVFKALPESVHVPASEESARAKLARIKELLK
jgi:hypothetical protein